MLSGSAHTLGDCAHVRCRDFAGRGGGLAVRPAEGAGPAGRADPLRARRQCAPGRRRGPGKRRHRPVPCNVNIVCDVIEGAGPNGVPGRPGAGRNRLRSRGRGCTATPGNLIRAMPTKGDHPAGRFFGPGCRSFRSRGCRPLARHRRAAAPGTTPGLGGRTGQRDAVLKVRPLDLPAAKRFRAAGQRRLVRCARHVIEPLTGSAPRRPAKDPSRLIAGPGTASTGRSSGGGR